MCLSLSSETEETPALRSPRFLLTSDSQSPRQLGIPGREASVAKMPSNSHPDASYKLTVSRLAKVFDGTSIHIRSPHLPKLPSQCTIPIWSIGYHGITNKMDGECLKMVQTHGFSGPLN